MERMRKMDNKRRVITPQEAWQDLSSRVEQYIDKIMPNIETILRHNMSVTVEMTHVPADIVVAVEHRLTILFSEAGWQVKTEKGNVHIWRGYIRDDTIHI